MSSKQNQNINFSLTNQQQLKFNEWIKTHTVKYDSVGARYTFSFSPSFGIGTTVIVYDPITQTKLDLSNYDD